MFTKSAPRTDDDAQAAAPRRRRPSSAHATAALALFVALGGTSYAAGSLAANSVGSKQIKSAAVRSSDLAPNAVSTSKVKDGSLKASDFQAGELPKGDKGDPGAPGEKGDKGDKGDAGAKGDTGAPGLSLYQQVDGSSVTVAAGATEQATASCPSGRVVLGGGYETSGSIGVTLNRSGPTSTTVWYVRVTNTTGSARTFNAQAICAKVG